MERLEAAGGWNHCTSDVAGRTLMDAVTGIDRSREEDALTRMVLLSFAAHATLLALVILLPTAWRAVVRDNRAVMTVTIDGDSGPRQGRNPIPARPVQKEPAAAAKPTTESPAAPSQTEMIEPLPSAQPHPRATFRTESRKGELQSQRQTPITGPQEKQGPARLETHAPSFRTGLATAGEGGDSAYTDLAQFCCPDYLATMVQLVQRNWQQNQGVEGTVVVSFTIRRDGLLGDVEVEQQSTPFLNLSAQRAVIATGQLPPLPAAFSGDHLRVHLVFQFKR